MVADVVVEVVVQTVDELLAARAAGADRVEVCVDLSVGGLTPPLDLVRDAVAQSEAMRVHVLVRPRPGDFVYTTTEIDEVVASIVAIGATFADGVVIGALTTDGDVDIEACRRMIVAAGAMSVTFHRAFDECRDPFAALDAIVDLGCDRILTSGQAATAPEGETMLCRLVDHAAGRIVILAGGGVRAENVARLVRWSGVREVHFSLSGAGSARAVIDAARRA